MNTALGGGLSSRLFQQIRESRGLAYSVYSTVDTFSDAGALSVYAACLPERFAEVAAVTAGVLETVARDGINYGEHRGLAQSLAHIDEVTLDEVNAIARTLLTRQYGAAVLGPHRSKRSLPKQLRALAG